MKPFNLSLNFSINEIALEDIKSDRFVKATIHAMADGENVHTHPISTEVLKRCSNTVYDIPVVCFYDKYMDDFQAHEKDEVPIGFVKESSPTYDNPILFEVAEDGRTFLVIKALIWKRYSGQALDVLQRNDRKKSVSVEFLATQFYEVDGKPVIEEFVLQGITILGDFIKPAIRGSNIQLEFSQDKADFLKEISFAENAIAIKNSKDDAVSGQWSNPRRKLFNPIVDATNTAPLIREAYLVNENVGDELQITKVKYPHHVIRNGNLVVHINGLQAAFQRAEQQGIVKGAVRAHLMRHYRELGLSSENFSKFNMSKEEFELYFSDGIAENESVGEKQMAKNKDMAVLTKQEDTAEVVVIPEGEVNLELADDKSKSEDMADKESDKNMADDNANARNGRGGNGDRDRYDDDDDDDDDRDDRDDDDDDDDDRQNMADGRTTGDQGPKATGDIASGDNGPEVRTGAGPSGPPETTGNQNPDAKDTARMSYEEMAEELEKMANENKRLEDENRAYMSKLESMSDYEDLKNFKAMAEDDSKKANEMQKMQQVMAEIESRGIEMSDEDKQSLLDRYVEFDSVEAWINFAKASVFDRVEAVGDIVKIGYPISQPKRASIWDKVI